MLILTGIFRNEALGIAETLDSVYDAIDGYAIVDTGSEDPTPDVIKVCCAGIPGELQHHPFIDFSTNRNQVLDIAGERFGDAAWSLMLSGDAVVERPDALESLAALATERGHDAVLLDIHYGGLVYPQAVLTRLGSSARYRGVTHEVVIAERPALARDLMPEGAPFIRYDAPATDKRKRWLLDAQLLEAEHARSSTPDPRTTFYLAQTWECLGANDRAAALYAQRITQEGFWEERFIAALRRARCLWRLQSSAAQIQAAYLQAHHIDAARAEPLHELSRFFFEEGTLDVALHYAERAAALPLPTKSTLFIERDVYAFAAMDQLNDIRAAIAERAA